MALTEKHKKIIDIIQWLLILAMAVVGIVVFFGHNDIKRDKVIASNETYVRIHESQTIESLKKRNRELYDSLNVVSAYKPESAVQFKYKYKYKTDTVYKTEFVTEYVYLENGDIADSIYHYSKDNDTIKTDIDVKAQGLEWVNVNAEINDKFMVINRINNGLVETTINHSGNAEIGDVTVWHNKKGFKDRLFIGPTIGVGYDPIHKKFSPTIGVSAGINLLKH